MATFPWQVESLRLSFINLVPGTDADNFGWSNLMPTDPESTTQKKALGIVTEQGGWLSGELIVNRHPGRVDVIYNFKQPDLFAESGSLLPNAGQFEEVVSYFSALAENVGGVRSSRIAFGAVLLLPVDDAAQGYKRLNDFLPFVRFEDDMSDFFLQVNRKRRSDLGIEVNELSKWGCVEVLGVPSIGVELPAVHALRLELDINTPDRAPPLEVDISRLVVDLIYRGRSIAEKGAV